MGTHASIGFISSTGTVRVVTLNKDGYPTGCGRKLVEHYDSRNAALSICSVGNISTLNAKMQDCIFSAIHIKDGNDHVNEFSSVEELISLRDACLYDHVYLYDEREYLAYNGQVNKYASTGSVGSSTGAIKTHWKYLDGTELVALNTDWVMRGDSE